MRDTERQEDPLPSDSRAVLEGHEVRTVAMATRRNITIRENTALLRDNWDGTEETLVGTPSLRHLTAAGFRTMLEYGGKTDVAHQDRRQSK